MRLIFSDADSTWEDVVQVSVSANPTPIRVNYYVDNVFQVSRASVPFAWAFDTASVDDGVHVIKAEGVYKNRSEFTTKTITIANDPPAPDPDTTDPTAPSALTEISDSQTSVTLGWDASTDAAGVLGYKVYKNSNFVADLPGDSLNYEFVGLVCGMSYNFGVEAYDLAGNVSTRSSVILSTESCPAPEETYVHASDLPWVSMVNGWGPVEKNKSNGENAAGDGNTLTLNGVTYTKGLGCHAFSEIKYALGGDATRFLSDVGVDDESTQGTVVFQVFVDGVKKYDSGLMTSESATQKVDVDLTNAQELKLVVTDGGDGNNHDHADWADAKFAPATFSPPVTPPTPPPTPTAADVVYPMSAHIWGGNTASAMLTHDIVIASDMSAGNPKQARVSNPSLVALAHPAFDPWNSDWTKRRSFALTYGGGLMSWAGGTDSLNPSPLGTIRAYNASIDTGYLAQGSYHFRLDRTQTIDLIMRAAWYCWKLGKGFENEWDGIWSDNLFTGNLLTSGNCFGSNGNLLDAAAWDNNLAWLMNQFRAKGVEFSGGNTVYRSNKEFVRESANVAMNETLEAQISQGPTAYATFLAEAMAWHKASEGKRYLICMHIVPQASTAVMKFGLALATIAGAAYLPYQSHSDLYMPAEMKNNGNRHYLGKAISDPTRSGNTWTRQFEHGTVTANHDTDTGTFSVA